MAPLSKLEVLGWSQDQDYKLPLVSATFGNPDPKAPVLGLFGGVHGLERIGTQVVLALMTSFLELLLWDRLIQDALKKIRIVWFPMVNPLGIMRKTRANPNGIDLMRNAPIDSYESPTFLVGGHRMSPFLPWFRGFAPRKMEVESNALIELLNREVFGSSRVITLDFHSGFGTVDRIWFPYAKSKSPFPNLPEVHAFKEAFERIHPHHVYKIEPQAKNYTTHGDLWDFAYDKYYQHLNRHESAKPHIDDVFLPFAIEMGSWMWVRKNPLQLFSALGPYNPMKPHRVKRILRRHNTLFDFLIRALVSPEVWVPTNQEQREKHRSRALNMWYHNDK